VSVQASFRVDVRPYSGSDDPSLPIAAWIGQAGQVGNGSGGNVIFSFLFQRDDDALVTESYNLEQLAVDTTSPTDVGGRMETLRMDQLSLNRTASPQIWTFLTVGRVGVSALQLQDSNILPLWLGAPNLDEGDKGIRFQFSNIDLRLYAITIQGYMWGPRSVLAPGGPRRPVGGLFGNG